ncbi:MAG: ABC transporter permease subunit, partial [Alphaproteobacteria bacterium]|nr:ABC transporter permease subunit [Alphaproteobacteria bacterium]
VVLAALWRRWTRARARRPGGAPPAWPVMAALVLGLPVLAFVLAGSPASAELPEMGRFNLTGGFFMPQAFTALFIALTTYTAAFVAEIVRGGIQSVSKGQREAASALGFRPGQTMRLIILPQALRVIIPPLTNQYLNLFKNSSLGVAIGYPELFATFGGTTLNQTGQAVEVLFLVGLFYLGVSLAGAMAMNLYNRVVALKGSS